MKEILGNFKINVYTLIKNCEKKYGLFRLYYDINQ